MLISTQDWTDVICRQVEEGNVVLVLGAGATASSHDRAGQPLKSSKALAVYLAEKAGLKYTDEGLQDVVTAVQQVLGESATNELISSQYKDCRPSPEIIDLFTFSWKRIYTFNIDDAIESIPKRGRAQEFKTKNALTDRLTDYDGIAQCEIIHLNGSVYDTTSGFIFSVDEYARRQHRPPVWYEKAGADFAVSPVVFIGTKYDEPLLAAQIERAKSEIGPRVGTSFLITPEDIGDIRRQSLAKHGIVHLQGGLAEFVTTIRSRHPNGVQPRQILSRNSRLTPDEDIELSHRDISALNAFKLIDQEFLLAKMRAAQGRIETVGKTFYSGFPPSWEVVASGVHIDLKSYDGMRKALSMPVSSAQFKVVLGDSGAGKTTGIMASVVARLRGEPNRLVLEYDDNGRPMSDAFYALASAFKERDITVLIDPLSIYVDEVYSILENSLYANIEIIASAREGEWNERINRRLGHRAHVFRMGRFEDSEVSTIVRKLDQFLPSPTFANLSPAQKEDQIRKARRQLLMLFKELSGGVRFDEIIADEFRNLSKDEDRLVFLVVGVATVARVGISAAAIITILRSAGISERLEDVLGRLGSMVSLTGGARYTARHELFVRHILDSVAGKDELFNAITALMAYFAQFEAPVVRHLDRKDYQLFKYVSNEDNLRRLMPGSGGKTKVHAFFEKFEVPFQRDGHFWLQYGLFMRSMNDHKAALELLTKSCAAFPGNDYALHALAQQKLMLAATERGERNRCERWISEAVEVLLNLDSRQSDVGSDSAIWSLSKYHIKALRAWSRNDEARAAARRYFERLSDLHKQYGDSKLNAARSSMLLLATVGKYEDF